MYSNENKTDNSNTLWKWRKEVLWFLVDPGAFCLW